MTPFTTGRLSVVPALCACLAFGALSGCAPDYSPNTYSGAAVQQANKVEQGVIIGIRQVDVLSQGATGAITGGAAGGIVGSQTAGGVGSAFGALGGTLIGGLVGSTVERSATDTKAFEYIVRKGNNEMVSVTQKDQHALALGQRVLVIAGNQARIVPDYTVQQDPKGARGVEEQAARDKAAEPTAPPAPSTQAAPTPLAPAAPASPAVEREALPAPAASPAPPTPEPSIAL